MTFLFDFLFIAGILFSGIYIYILYKSKERGLSQSILILFFAILSIILLDSYAYLHDLTTLKLFTFLPTNGSKFLLGALLLLYIQSLFFEDKTVLKNSFFYLIPFVTFFVGVSLPIWIARLSERYLLDYSFVLEENNQIIRIVSDAVFLGFLYVCFKMFFKFKRVLRCNYSHIEHNNFIWIRYLLIAAAVIISFDMLLALYQMFFGYFSWRSQNVIMLLLAVFILYAGYFGLRQSKVLVPYFLLEGDQKTFSTNATPTSTQNLENSALKQLLITHMETEQPYLDEELTLNKLAMGIDTTDKKLSYLLNQYLNTTFYNFVNAYRIEAYKRSVQSGDFQEYTIEGIAYECGFKSKASFYRLFKKETGKSPSEYKNSLK